MSLTGITERRSTPHIRFREAQNVKPVHKHPGLDPSRASTFVLFGDRQIP